MRSLPFHATLPAERTQLKEDAEALRAKATEAVRDLNAELDTGRRLEVEAEQVNVDTPIVIQSHIVRQKI